MRSCLGEGLDGLQRRLLAKFRVIEPLRNVDAEYHAFGITSGKYHSAPAERTRIS